MFVLASDSWNLVIIPDLKVCMSQLDLTNIFERHLHNAVVYLTFTTGGEIWKSDGHFDFQTVNVHMDTPEQTAK